MQYCSVKTYFSWLAEVYFLSVGYVINILSGGV